MRNKNKTETTHTPTRIYSYTTSITYTYTQNKQKYHTKKQLTNMHFSRIIIDNKLTRIKTLRRERDLVFVVVVVAVCLLCVGYFITTMDNYIFVSFSLLNLKQSINHDQSNGYIFVPARGVCLSV